MAGLPEVIGLLHRADWTRLSLSAQVRFEQDGDLARRRQAAVWAEMMRRWGIRPGPDGWPSAKQEPEDERGGYHRWRAALLIAPGRRYRLEYEGDYGDWADGSDGEQGWTLWQVRENVTLVGPARPMTGEFASMVGSSWLLGKRLSGGTEITYHGRRGYHLRVTRGDGALPGGASMFYPLDAIVDAETGSLLRLIAYDGDAPAAWWELDDVTTEPGGTADPAGFRPRIPPGARVLEESGHPMVDATAVMPGLTGTAARTATAAVRRTAGAVSAARTFIDTLRRPAP